MTNITIEGKNNSQLAHAMMAMLKKEGRAAVLNENGRVFFTDAGLRKKNRGEEIEVTIQTL